MSGNFKFQISNFRFRRPQPVRSGTCNSKFEICNLKSEIPSRRAFTLVELLIVILIIGIMAGLALSAISAAGEFAREQRTRAIIAKLDQLIMEKYESYRTRAVPLQASTRRPTATDPTPQRTAAQNRLTGIRELMRLELPDRISDLCSASELIDLQTGNHLNLVAFPNQVQTAVIKSIPSVTRAYKRHAQRITAYEFNKNNNYPGWSIQYQGSECLYLIVCQMLDGDKQAIDYFAPEEIGDVDGDGMKEILDGWGQPIEFLRWAPGYVTNPWDATRAPMLTTQTRPDGANVYTPDIFDPAKVDVRLNLSNNTDITDDPFELRPLLISGGRDKLIDIILDDYNPTPPNPTPPPPTGPPRPMDPTTWIPLVYRTQTIPNDPYVGLPNASPPQQAPPQPSLFRRIGEPLPASVSTGYADNLTNHFQETP